MTPRNCNGSAQPRQGARKSVDADDQQAATRALGARGDAKAAQTSILV
jgi:hypothetical protein